MDRIQPGAVLYRPEVKEERNIEIIKAIIIIGLSLVVGYCIHAGIGLVGP